MKKTIQYNSNANLDKSSRSVISRSSRLTKKNPQQENQQTVLHYFRKDKIGDKVRERTSKPKSPEKTQSNHLDRVGKIITDLMNRHKKAKQKLQKLKQQSQKQHDKQCPFTPTKNKLQRYQVVGDVVRRNQIWLRQKRRKELELKQQIALDELKVCTFSPSFSSKKTSQSYLKQRDLSRSLTPKARNHNSRGAHQNVSPYKTSKREFTQAEYEMAKRNLISKMMNFLQ